MVKRDFPTANELRQLFYYDLSAEKLIRLRRPNSLFSSKREADRWNGMYSGKEPYYGSTNGYATIKICGRRRLAHRVIWAVFYGEDAPRIIDHANCIRSDNRICNLRSATASQNCHNTYVRRNNRSGVKGIYLESETGRWKAQIRIDGKKTHLGRFDSQEDASIAYRLAAEKHYGEFSRA